MSVDMAMRIEELAGSLQMARSQRDDLQGVRVYILLSPALQFSCTTALCHSSPTRAIPPEFPRSLPVSPSFDLSHAHVCW